MLGLDRYKCNVCYVKRGHRAKTLIFWKWKENRMYDMSSSAWIWNITSSTSTHHIHTLYNTWNWPVIWMETGILLGNTPGRNQPLSPVLTGLVRWTSTMVLYNKMIKYAILINNQAKHIFLSTICLRLQLLNNYVLENSICTLIVLRLCDIWIIVFMILKLPLYYNSNLFNDNSNIKWNGNTIMYIRCATLSNVHES